MKKRKQMRVIARSVLAFFGLAGGTVYAQQGPASLNVNLVFPNGQHTMSLSSEDEGLDFPILVYGTVTGVNPVTTTSGASTGNFDGIQYTYYNIISSANPGSALPGSIDTGDYGPLLNGQPQNGSNPATGFNGFGSQAGNVADINGDGIADLGSTTVLTLMAKPRVASPLWDNQSLVDNDPTGASDIIVGGSNSNSVSFLLETIYFQAGDSLTPGESTTFNPTIASTGGYAPAVYFVDTPNEPMPMQTAGALYTFNNVSAGSPVTFTVTAVPEPATAAASCLIGAGLLARRRRRRV